ncbi:MAG: hypothetical protein AAGB24_04675 [Bacteroidota bacterium]
MQKLCVIAFSMLVFLGCGKTQEETQVADSQTLLFEYQKMPPKAPINLEAAQLLDGWPEFGGLTQSFNVLYQAKTHEDLGFAVDDLLAKEKILRESTYPETFDKAQIKSRQKVLRTFLLKTKATVVERRNATAATVEMLIAYNAFRDQFNIIINNALDTKLILDEE